MHAFTHPAPTNLSRYSSGGMRCQGVDMCMHSSDCGSRGGFDRETRVRVPKDRTRQTGVYGRTERTCDRVRTMDTTECQYM